MSTGRRIGLLLLALALAAFGIERLIETDAEQIESLVDDAVAAYNAKAFDKLADVLDPDFQFGQQARDEALARLQRLTKRFQVSGVTADLDEIVVEGDTAKAKALVRLRARGALGQISIRLRFARVDEVWRLVGGESRGFGGY